MIDAPVCEYDGRELSRDEVTESLELGALMCYDCIGETVCEMTCEKCESTDSSLVGRINPVHHCRKCGNEWAM